MSDATDRALLERSGRGDARAFEEFVRRWETPLYRFLRRVLGSADAAEDARQVTFVRAYQGAARFRGGSVTTWLFRIAHRVASNHRRSEARARLQPLDDAQPLADAGPTPCERVQEAEERAALGRALDALEPDDRALLWLRVAEGQPLEATARILGRPASTLRYRLAKALGEVRRTLGSQLERGRRHAMP